MRKGRKKKEEKRPWFPGGRATGVLVEFKKNGRTHQKKDQSQRI